MSFECKTLGPLADQFPATGLFGAWLRDLPIPASEGAGAQWRAALAAPGPLAKAPLWQDEKFARLLPTEFQALRTGPAVVVTGQQPGFLGGPLLTLFKIATAIAAARQRTAAGRPTVAVFWSGDDDDDLAEALAPVGWDTGAQELW
ncbi:MAG: bacillithiol biosynthesis BshC, partial [Candidatus Krumholzibacteria bacterium]|nr:bacillithiol biosynthesis BshC [Candidatus Krumholzibacteria bacterium]